MTISNLVGFRSYVRTNTQGQQVPTVALHFNSRPNSDDFNGFATSSYTVSGDAVKDLPELVLGGDYVVLTESRSYQGRSYTVCTGLIKQ